MAMFENFPYTDMHNLNLDWIIKIAKDFLDQYTHIQQLINDGEESLQNLTTEGLQQLQDKADNLETLLNAWYETHSSDIANELATAINDILSTETTALQNIQSTATTALSNFISEATNRSNQLLDSWPSDYSDIVNKYDEFQKNLKALNIMTGANASGVFKNGIAALSMDDPIASTFAKYTIFDIDNVNGLFYANSNTSYHILVKMGFFNSSRTNIYLDDNWADITNSKAISTNLLEAYPTTKYITITVVYSTSSSIDDRVDNIPLDDMIISTVSKIEKQSVLKNTDDIYSLTDIINSKFINNFEYGAYVSNSMIKTLSNGRLRKCILIDIETIDKPLYLYYDYGSLKMCLYVQVFDANGNMILDSGEWTYHSSGWLAVRPSYPTLPTARYVSITMFLTTTTDISGISLFPEDNKMYLTYKQKSFYTVSNTCNADFTSINDAIQGTTMNDVIIILPGTYNETVRMWSRKRTLIGVDREKCIVYAGSGLYDNPALEANIGNISNLTFISGNDNDLSESSQVQKGYAVHIESSNADPFELIFDNCKFISYLNAGAGIGCRYNQTIKFNNCYFETKANQTYSSTTLNLINSAAVLFHNDATVSQAASAGVLVFNNCEMKGVSKAIMARSVENNTEMTVRFNKNLAYVQNNGISNVVGYWGDAGKGISPYFCGTDIKLDSLSYGNNSPELDYTNYWN